MENIIYNDLIRRGFDVDVGVVEIATKDEAGIQYVGIENFLTDEGLLK